MAVPNVSYKVEIAFNAGYRTPAASRTWTDVSAYAELGNGMGITYGRADEISVADANQFNVTLDNKDGRFTFGNAASPYYPDVKIGRPIRLTATVDGNDYVRFTGYVNEWPVEWPGGAEGYATATVTASSRLSRLGLDSPLVSPFIAACLNEGAEGVWPLYEGAESLVGANAVPGGALGDLEKTGSGTVTFAAGTDVNGVEESAVLLNDGALLAPGSFTDTGFGVIFTMTTTSVSTGGLPVKVFTMDLGGSWAVQIAYTTTNTEFSFYTPNGVLVMLTSELLNDGQPHTLFALVREAVPGFAVALIQIDGGTPVTSGLLADPGGVGSISGIAFGSGYWPEGLSSPLVAAFCNAAILLDPISDSTALCSAGTAEAFSGQTTKQRIDMLASWANIDAAEVTSSTGQAILMAGMAIENTQIVELMRQVETTEAGVLYDGRDGKLVLREREDRYRRAVSLQVDFDDHKVGVDYAPKVDRLGIKNVGKGTNTRGTVDVTYTDEASREEYGDASYQVQTAALSPDEPLQLVAAVVNANAEPRARVPAVTLNVIDWIGHVDLPALLNLDIGSRVQLINSPTQAATSTVDYFVEGYSETFGVSVWSIALNLSPSWPTDSVFVLNDATFGELDSDNLIAP